MYFDLEQPAERIRLDVQWEALMKQKKLVVLDEAQAWPEVFPRLRGAIDTDRKRVGRFLLLGSVSPALMRHVSQNHRRAAGVGRTGSVAHFGIARRAAGGAVAPGRLPRRWSERRQSLSPMAAGLSYPAGPARSTGLGAAGQTGGDGSAPVHDRSCARADLERHRLRKASG